MLALVYSPSSTKQLAYNILPSISSKRYLMDNILTIKRAKWAL